MGRSPAPNALWPEYQPKAAALRKQGYNNYEIGKMLGIDPRNIYYWMGPSPGKKWRGNGMHDRARYLRECGYTISEISEQINVPRSTVGDWIRGMPCD